MSAPAMFPRLHRVALLPVVTALALMFPTSASASWYLLRVQAMLYTDQTVMGHYYDQDPTASCKPRGERYDPRYVYHRWVCSWRAHYYVGDVGYLCRGALLITGTKSSFSSFRWSVLRGQRCDYG